MTKHAYVSSTANPLLPGRAAIPDLSFPDARCVATPDNEHEVRWRHIISSLGASGAARRNHNATEALQRSRRSCRDRAFDYGYGLDVTIEILDRPNAVSVVISWRDPTRCSYGYQRWKKAVARRTGICALSGVLVRRGDAIFRPALRGDRPSNAFAMILAVYIDSPQFALPNTPQSCPPDFEQRSTAYSTQIEQPFHSKASAVDVATLGKLFYSFSPPMVKPFRRLRIDSPESVKRCAL